VVDPSMPDNLHARTAAEIIQRVRPDALLINEFDLDLFKNRGGTPPNPAAVPSRDASANGPPSIIHLSTDRSRHQPGQGIRER
jgi:hypothetical protein